MKKYIVVEIIGNFTYKEIYQTHSKKTADLRLMLNERIYKNKKFKIITLN